MMLGTSHTTIVIVPGLRGHVEDHWQTHLATRLPDARVAASYGRDKQDLEGRVADLQRVVDDVVGPVTLVAHSAGVLTTLHWARRHAGPDGADRVVGALLATPPDLGKELPAEYPTLAQLAGAGWLPVPTMPLPFPSIVAASTNDPLGDLDRVRALADRWGSWLIDIGPVGHLNPAAGYGEWPGAETMLDLLAAMRPAALTA
jgi:predicted alpha/beta hydrolase family esterase